MPSPPYSCGQLDAEQAHLGETGQHALRDLFFPINRIGIDLRFEELLQLDQNRVTGGTVFFRLFRKRENQVGCQPAHKQLADKARLLPFGFTRRFGNLN
jgi:hypothetical protein